MPNSEFYQVQGNIWKFPFVFLNSNGVLPFIGFPQNSTWLFEISRICSGITRHQENTFVWKLAELFPVFLNIEKFHEDFQSRGTRRVAVYLYLHVSLHILLIPTLRANKVISKLSGQGSLR